MISVWNILILVSESSQAVAVACRAGVTCSDIFRKEREFLTLHLREASAGFNASNLLKLFIPSNSHNKNLYPQPLFLISEWLGGEEQEYQSKIHKHLERDSTGANFLCNRIPTIESCDIIYPTHRSLLDAFNLPQQPNYASYLLWKILIYILVIKDCY